MDGNYERTEAECLVCLAPILSDTVVKRCYDCSSKLLPIPFFELGFPFPMDAPSVDDAWGYDDWCVYSTTGREDRLWFQLCPPIKGS